MAIVGWVIAGWRWWMVCMLDKARGVCRMSGDAKALPVCMMIYWWHLITLPSRCTALAMVEPYLVSLDLYMGHHEKAWVRCLCRRLATLHGVTWTHRWVAFADLKKDGASSHSGVRKNILHYDNRFGWRFEIRVGMLNKGGVGVKGGELFTLFSSLFVKSWQDALSQICGYALQSGRCLEE